MKVSFEVLQRAFIQGDISLEQLIEVLMDNFGVKKTRQILRRNLELALKQETKSDLQEQSE